MQTLPLWTGERDADAIETAGPVPSDTKVGRFLAKAKMPPAPRCAARLADRRSDLNRESMRRLAELRPALALSGHGPPLRDPARLARVAGI